MSITPHQLNCLLSTERSIKLSTLNSINSVIQSINELTQAECVDELVHVLIKLQSDHIELVREKSLNILLCIIQHEYQSPVLAPVIDTVMTCSQEPSEEIRLKQVELINTCVQHNTVSFQRIDDHTVQHTVDVYLTYIGDPYSEIKKLVCNGIVLLVQACMSYNIVSIHQHYTRIYHALLICTKHQQSAVRISSLHALSQLIITTNSTMNNHTFTPFNNDSYMLIEQLVYDKTVKVKEVLLQCITRWLIQCTYIIDTIQYQLIELILCLLVEQNISLQHSILQSVEQIAISQKSIQNNHKTDTVSSWPDQSLTEPFTTQPSHITSAYITQQLNHLIHHTIIMMNDWSLPKRQSYTFVFHALIIYSQTAVTTYLHDIIHACSKHINNDDQLINTQLQKTIQCIGYFVSIAWCDIILQSINSASSNMQRINILCTASLLISGYNINNTNDYVYINQLINVLHESDISCSDDASLRYSVLQCITAILNKFIDCTLLNSEIILLTLLKLDIAASPTSIPLTNEQQHILNVANQLAHLLHTNDVYGHDCVSMLQNILTDNVDITQWNQSTVQQQLYFRLLQRSVSKLSQHVDVVLPVLVQCCHKDVDIYMNTQVISTIYLLLLQTHTIQLLSQQSLHTIVTQLLQPMLVWRVSRVAAIVRLQSCICLNIILQSSLLQHDVLVSCSNQLIPVLISCTSDEENDIRLNSLISLQHIFIQCNVMLDTKSCITIQNELIKRLDDSIDTIRLHSIQCMTVLLKRLPDIQQYDSDCIQLQHIIKTMLIHLNDTNNDVVQSIKQYMYALIDYTPDAVKPILTDNTSNTLQNSNIQSFVSYCNNVKQ